MEGLFDEGSFLFYDDQPSEPTDAMIGKLCVIWLDDGRVVVKRLMPSRAPGRFDLVSYNEGTIVGAVVDRAARVRFIQPS